MTAQVIAGLAKGLRLQAPLGLHTRPTSAKVRGAVFNKLMGLIEETRFVDLYAGAGLVGLEAASRGAREVWFVENDRHALQAIRQNISAYQARVKEHQKQNLVVVSQDVIAFLKHLLTTDQKFDNAWADPPYFMAKDNLGLLCNQLLHVVPPDGRFIMEASSELLDTPDWQQSIDGWSIHKINELGKTILIDLIRT